MKLAVFETEQWEHDACLHLRPAYEVSCVRDILDEASARIHAKADIISSFVYSQLDARVLAHFAQLRLIATRSTGYDHIDLGYCQSRGIIVCNVPGYGDTSVAEHVFALLLGLARKIADAAERTRRGRFDQAGLRGFELKGRTIAVIGAGRIGMRVIEIARGFSMDVIAVDARPDELAAQRLGFRYASLDAALGQADIVTLHVPATPETRRLIAEREFALMKPGAVLINTARGSVVDAEALVRALAEGRLAGAGLDVMAQEAQLRDEAQIFRAGAGTNADLRAFVANHALLGFANVLVTPHNAYNTTEALARIIDTTLANIEAFARGAPRNVVAAP